MQRSLSQGRTQCIFSPIGLPVFSDQLLFQLSQDQKGLFKACNGAECKVMTFLAFLDLPLSFHHTPNLGIWPKLAIQLNHNFMRIMGNGKKKSLFSSSFFQRKVRLKGCSKEVHTHSQGRPQK
ncbi:hypothetical protein H5410_062003, partial [Solanum commersonii]